LFKNAVPSTCASERKEEEKNADKDVDTLNLV